MLLLGHKQLLSKMTLHDKHASTLSQPTAPQAQRLALSRARPPLSAAPSVWSRRREPIAPLDHAPWPHAAHAAAAVTERAFWSRVALRPLMQPGGREAAAAAAAGRVPVGGLTVGKDVGYVTVLSAAPSGAFLAAGTSHGAVVVWNLREDQHKDPWYQVGWVHCVAWGVPLGAE